MRRDRPRPKPPEKSLAKSPVHAPAKPTASADSPPRRDDSVRRPVRICGFPAVAALFATAPERVERLYFDASVGGKAGAFCKTLAQLRKPYKQVPPEELARIAGTPMHGSIVALAGPRLVPVLDRAAMVDRARAWARAGDPLLILDGVSNPHNLGAIARTAAFFGLKRILLSDDPRQALPSDAAYRVARGGLEHVELVQARDLALVLKALAPNFLVVGAALGNGNPPEAFASGARLLALVMGNEEDGLGSQTLAACDAIVTIPGVGAGRMQSLNVAASSAILIHAMLTRRGQTLRV